MLRFTILDMCYKGEVLPASIINKRADFYLNAAKLPVLGMLKLIMVLCTFLVRAALRYKEAA